MHHIIYMSQVKRPLSPTTLIALLMQARALNEYRNITGALVYGDGQFIQVIEGEEESVNALYQRISQDKRHENVFKLADKAISERSFQEWTMAFQELSPAQFADLSGYVSPSELEQQLHAINATDKLLLDKMKELLHPA
jgi:hypothetical protein